MMKRTVQLTGILLMLLLACNMPLSAQRWMRNATDSTRMNHMRLASDTLNKRGMNGRNRMGPARMDHTRDRFSQRHFGADRMILGSIPNVTEKQKKEISDLMAKQQDDMKKLREEMQTRMKALRDSHSKSVLNILTDEQKKFVESRSENSIIVPEKTK